MLLLFLRGVVILVEHGHTMLLAVLGSRVLTNCFLLA